MDQLMKRKTKKIIQREKNVSFLFNTTLSLNICAEERRKKIDKNDRIWYKNSVQSTTKLEYIFVIKFYLVYPRIIDKTRF